MFNVINKTAARMIRPLITAQLVVLSFSLSTVAQSLPPGSLDPSFGNGGIISRGIGSPSIARAVGVQTDGKIVMTGWYARTFGLIRYNANGSPDNSFGVNGVASTNINNWAFVEGMGIQNDGRIVVAGWSYQGRQIAAVARFKSDGSLDTTFGSGGSVTTASPLTAPAPNVFNFYALDTALQSDGKIVVVGESYYCAIGDDFCDFGTVEDYFTAVRYNADGSVDTTFGNNGFIVETEASYYSPKVAVLNDGGILVTGGASILKYKSDGSRDTTFGNGGVASTSNTASDIAIQPDGKIVISFYAYAEGSQAFGVARFKGNGTPDPTFGGGEVLTPGGGYYGSVSNTLAIQADGRIVVAGTGFDENVDWRYVVRRYNPNGSLDHSYGTDGLVRVHVGGLHNEAFAVAVDAEGRAVIAGCAFSDAGWGLIRLTGGGLVPTDNQKAPFDYDGDGKTDVSVFRPSTNEWHIMQSSGGIRVQGWGLAGDKMAPADFDGDGKTDIAVFRPGEGNWYVLNSSNNTVTVAGWGLLGDLPVPADYNGDSKADLVVYRPSNRNWYRRDSDGLIHVFEWGLADDRPAPADFTGDGRTDMAVFRPGTGTWYVLSSSDFSVTTNNWGVSGDIPVGADYSGDGKADFVVFRPSDLTWYRRNTDDGSLHFITWGLAGDIPAPGDFDGDGKQDLAVFRPSNGTWYIFGSQAGIYSQPFGLAADRPTPNSFVY